MQAQEHIHPFKSVGGSHRRRIHGDCNRFVSLFDEFMIQHLNRLHREIARLEVADSKLEANLQPLEVLHSVDLICHLWQQYTNMALFPLAASSVTTRREMTIFNIQTVSRIEGAANALLQRMIDGQSLLLFVRRYMLTL